MGRQPHIVAVPYPAQGLVKPLLSLSYKIAAQGIKVTFVNTEIIHAKLIAALPDREKGGLGQKGITLESIADGLEHENDQNDGEKFLQTIRRVMPHQLRDLIESINHSNVDEPVSCIIADVTVGWILEAAENVGVEQVAFIPFSPACIANLFNDVSRHNETGVMDSTTGIIPENEQINVSKDIPEDEKTHQHQFDELALGLVLSGQPFLWVVRADIADGSPAVFPEGFLERVANLGKIVEWTPQEMVLAHPAIACFFSHCEWNSTMEGLSLGVPFLCWPYFGDQLFNQKYTCDVWKIGLKLKADENGIRSRHEIKIKIKKLLSDGIIKVNASNLKDLAKESVSKGGSSYKNFEKFISRLKY